MASPSNPQSLFNVFVYGSLLADDVVRALLKRVPPSSPAILRNLFVSHSLVFLDGMHMTFLNSSYTLLANGLISFSVDMDILPFEMNQIEDCDFNVNSISLRIKVSIPALHGIIHRFSIKGCVYPAILPVENKKVNGKVLSGITVLELDILDKFEDFEYERRTVDVSLTDSSNTLMVEAYVWADQSDPNLYGEWDFEEWEQLHKKSFLKMTMEFLEELEQSDQSSRI
ncbi:hypothetical protein HAX54_019968 [Datura stramonium]|uniref:Putative gamma-glutamylcyclotransferase n=1 Tax=Datura stramonium TaxID=4076 RepID=A0ABS8USK3_DATST|nr:hypothetical protein [Datura stramonium]